MLFRSVMPEGMQTVSTEAILTSIACGLVVDTLLILNNYRDYDNDIKAGKKSCELDVREPLV